MINPAGNLDLDVWRRLATGGAVALPNFGLETVHHVHADDVAQGFIRAIDRQSEAVGNSFHVVSERALTLRGFAESVAGWFGQTADLRLLPFDQFRSEVGDANADVSWEHVSRSPSASIEKARRLLGYSPRYTSLQAVREALAALDLGTVTLD